MTPTEEETDEWEQGINESIDVINDLNRRIANPSTPPEDRAKHEQSREEELGKVEDIALSRPNNPRAQMDVAAALDKVKQPDRALRFSEAAIALSQGKPKLESEARLLRGSLLQKQGDFPGAARDCRRALELDQGNHAALACYQLNKNRAPAADRTKAPGPAVPAVVGAPAQAPVAPAAAPGADPASRGTAAPGLADADALKAATLIREGRVKLGLGDKRTAVEHGERAGAADPGNAKALVLQSLAYHALKLYEAALTAARAAAALDPDDAEAWAAMAEAKHALGYALEDVLHDAGKAARLDQAFRRRFEELAARASAESATPGGSSDAAPTRKGAGNLMTGLFGGILPAADNSRTAGLILLVIIGAMSLGGLWLWLQKRKRKRDS